jgi:hypothetical protein
MKLASSVAGNMHLPGLRARYVEYLRRAWLPELWPLRPFQLNQPPRSIVPVLRVCPDVRATPP